VTPAFNQKIFWCPSEKVTPLGGTYTQGHYGNNEWYKDSSQGFNGTEFHQYLI
jgi:hypothetical protein